MSSFPKIDNSGAAGLAEVSSSTTPQQASGDHPLSSSVAQAQSFESDSFDPYNFDSNKFNFSAEQLKCPVVIENLTKTENAYLVHTR